MPISPLSIPPSQYWRGDDGQWSTFWIEVGTPGQALELLPGTSSRAGNSIWVVIPQGCSLANPGLVGCDLNRGHLFFPNQSTTWSTSRLANSGLYSLDTHPEDVLGLYGSAYYGFDVVTLGGTFNPGLPTLQNQLVAGIATNDFWLGSLGLSPTPFNFSSLNDPIPSLLGSLKNDSLVPSTTWAYTAGMPYREPPVYGSLTLGGYDASRLSKQNSVSMPFGTDTSRDLLVGLQSITYDTLGSSPLLSSGIYAFIDSTVSQMWLPLETCQAFERSFNLTWNATTELYALTDSQHTSLLAQNPTFTFTVGSSAEGGESADIVFPYTAFDLDATPPFVESETKYFPLKRAGNSSQYTLGRMFLQEAYVVADYDRRNFSVSQAAIPSRDTPSQMVAINPPGKELVYHGSGSVSKQLSTGALAGVVVGGIVALVAIIAVILLIRKAFLGHRAAPDSDDPQEPFAANRYSGKSLRLKSPVEVNAVESELHEADPRFGQRIELDGNAGWPKHPARIYEMRDRRSVVVELEAPVDRYLRENRQERVVESDQS